MNSLQETEGTENRLNALVFCQRWVVWWGCHFLVFFPSLLTVDSAIWITSCSLYWALPPVTLRLLRFIALVHRNHVSPFSSIHISTIRNSAFFRGYKHAQSPSHAKRNAKFYFCELDVFNPSVLHVAICFDSLLRLWSCSHMLPSSDCTVLYNLQQHGLIRTETCGRNQVFCRKVSCLTNIWWSLFSWFGSQR
jgi:hypothetical protein